VEKFRDDGKTSESGPDLLYTEAGFGQAASGTQRRI
jgi:hypothetical protein